MKHLNGNLSLYSSYEVRVLEEGEGEEVTPLPSGKESYTEPHLKKQKLYQIFFKMAAYW